MSDHYFAPSALDRIALCPGSYWASKGKPKQPPTQAMEDGIRRHALLSWKVQNLKSHWLPEIEVEGKTYKITSNDTALVGKILPYIEAHPALADPICGRVYSEQRVEISEWCGHEPGECWGIADLILFSRNEYEVLDAKFGSYPVQPETLQSKAYAVGGGKFGDWDGPVAVHRQVRTAKIGILQPLDSTVVKVTAHPLHKIGDWAREIGEVISKAKDKNAPFAAGDHCKFCLAKSECETYRKYVSGAATVAFGGAMEHAQTPAAISATENIASLSEIGTSQDPKALSPDELGRILDQAEIIEGFFKDCRAVAEKRLSDGERIPGWKMIEGATQRKYIEEDDEKVVANLRKCGLAVKDCWKKTVLSPAQAEIAVKTKNPKKLEIFNELIKKVAGKPRLAPESHPAPAVGANLFEDLDAPPKAQEAPAAATFDWM